MIRLGERVRDAITGFLGIVVARTEWLHGCDRVTVESTELKEREPRDLREFDEARLEVIPGSNFVAHNPRLAASGAPGGPRPSPGEPSTPSERPARQERGL